MNRCYSQKSEPSAAQSSMKQHKLAWSSTMPPWEAWHSTTQQPGEKMLQPTVSGVSELPVYYGRSDPLKSVPRFVRGRPFKWHRARSKERRRQNAVTHLCFAPVIQLCPTTATNAIWITYLKKHMVGELAKIYCFESKIQDLNVIEDL